MARLVYWTLTLTAATLALGLAYLDRSLVSGGVCGYFGERNTPCASPDFGPFSAAVASLAAGLAVVSVHGYRAARTHESLTAGLGRHLLLSLSIPAGMLLVQAALAPFR